MKRSTFLTFVAFTAGMVGTIALFFPSVLITQIKMASASDSANVMARTVGVLLLSTAVLNFSVRNSEDSPALRGILIGNLFMQLAIMPIDPLAYANGVFHTLGSFVPNTVLHVFLASGFAYYLAKMNAARVGTASPSARGR